MLREIREFRRLDNPNRDRIVLVTVGIAPDQPLPGGLDANLSRVERIALDDLTGRWALLRSGARRALQDRIDRLAAAGYRVRMEDMPIIRQESERRAEARRRRVAVTSLAAIAVLAAALVYAIGQTVEARRAQYETATSQSNLNASRAGAFALLASGAAARDEHAVALRLLTNANMAAWVPQVAAENLAAPRPLVSSGRKVHDAGWPLAFLPGSHTLAIGAFDGTVMLTEPDTGATRTLRAADGTPIVGLAFADADQLVVVARSPADAAWNFGTASVPTGSVELWNLRSGKHSGIRCLPAGQQWLSVGTAPGTGVIIVGSAHGVWLLRQGADRCDQLDTTIAAARVALAPDASYAAATDIWGSAKSGV